MKTIKKLQLTVMFFTIFRVDGAGAVPPNWTKDEWSKFLSVIKTVETGNFSGIGVIGDDNKAYGPYQIHESYFKDAAEYDKTIKGEWKDCLTDKELSEKVIRAYMNRYLPKDASFETASRIHNGGPKGHKKQSTNSYWKKVQALWN